MPGPARPIPAANLAAFLDHCSGNSVPPAPSAVFIVRCAFPTSSWLEMIGQRGLVIIDMNASMSVFIPRAADWISPGFPLSFTSRCWNSVYHCASKPPPVPSFCVGRVMLGA